MEKEMDGNRLLLRPVEAAEALGLGRSTIFEMLASGELPRVRFGRAVRSPMDELQAFIKERTERSGDQRDSDLRLTA